MKLILQFTSFNTSHVTLYLLPLRSGSWPRCVSIHHMLLFILGRTRSGLWCLRFNTSHVTLYRVKAPDTRKFTTVSIHHMLLFIRARRGVCDEHKRVSIHHMLLFIIIKGQGWRKPITGFNTSHVTLYQGKHQGRHCVRQFQYITCYSLSQYPYRYKETQNSFQYITCYSLSICYTLSFNPPC